MKTTETVELLVRDTVASLGFELCDVEFRKEYGDWVLTLYIDRPEGVDLDACETVSRAVDPILDEADPIPQAYYLSVSSLGLDRPLKKDADFQRSIGKEVDVRLYAPQNGVKERNGILQSFDAEHFTILPEGGEPVEILRKDAALVRPTVHF